MSMTRVSRVESIKSSQSSRVVMNFELVRRIPLSNQLEFHAKSMILENP